MEVVLSGDRAGLHSDAREQEMQNSTVAKLRLLWQHRRLLSRTAAWGLLAATLIAFLIPKQYESTTRLMPPDNQSNAGMMMFASLTGKLSGNLSNLAGDIFGVHSTGDLFIGILRSRTIQDDLVDKFQLKKVYWKRTQQDARQALAANTAISEDHKSGIIAITVTDHSPTRAAAMAQEYVTELNGVVSHLSTSSAGRERVFLNKGWHRSSRIWKRQKKILVNMPARAEQLTSRSKGKPC